MNREAENRYSLDKETKRTKDGKKEVVLVLLILVLLMVLLITGQLCDLAIGLWQALASAMSWRQE